MSCNFKDIGAFLYKKLTYFVISLITSLGFAQADSASSGPEKVGRFEAEVVNVNTTRWLGADVLNWSVPVSRPVSELVKLSGSSSLSSLLAMTHPSLDVRHYGTQSGISFASFRGLPAEYTAVYRNGVRISNEQHRLADLSKHALRWADRIEVTTGLAAGVWGGDIGGAVVHISDDVPIGKSNASVFYGRSSFDNIATLGESELSLHTHQSLSDDIGVNASASFLRSDGRFPFIQQTSKNELVRENNDSYLTIFDIAPSFRLSNSSYLRTFATYCEIERGVPGPATSEVSGTSSPFARQFDRDILVAASYYHTFGINTSFLFGTASYQSQLQTYKNPQIHIDDEYHNRMYSTALRYHFDVAESIPFTASLSYARCELDGSQNARVDSSDIVRDHITASFVSGLDFTDQVSMRVSVNAEHLSDRSLLQLTPAVSLQYSIAGYNDPWLTVSVLAGSFYHPPSFNMLYWKVGGNEELRSEKGMTYELNTKLQFTDGGSEQLMIAVNGYHMLVRDQIVWLPGNGGIYSPINILNASTSGLETDIRYIRQLTYGVGMTIGGMVSLNRAKNLTDGGNYGKQLPFSIPYRLLMTLGVDHNDFGALSGIVKYRSDRYTDLANQVATQLHWVMTFDLLYKSPGIELFNGFPLSFSLGIQNLTDERYEEIFNYPQPGRMILFGIELNTKPQLQ